MSNDNNELKNNEALCREKQESCELTEEELDQVTGGSADNSNKMQVGLRFAIREGGRTVGSGTVAEIQE